MRQFRVELLSLSRVKKTARKEIQGCTEALDLRDKVQGEGIGICVRDIALLLKKHV